MLQNAPREFLFLHQHIELCFIWKEQCQICSQYAVLYQAKHLLVFIAVQFGENVVALLENDAGRKELNGSTPEFKLNAFLSRMTNLL